MRNNQYQIPQSALSAPIAPVSSYGIYKQLEQDIEILRAAADESLLPRYRLKTLVRPIARRLTPLDQASNLLRELVDIESEIGGTLFSKSIGVIAQRFWYFQGDWFYEATFDTGVTHYLRYHLTDTSAEKLYNGRLVPFDGGDQGSELSHLLAIIPRYVDAIRHQLYQRDGGSLV